MILSILDRLLILNLDTLPQTGSILTMKIKQQLLREAGFDEEEIKDCNIAEKSDPSGKNMITWDKDPGKDVAIGPETLKLLVASMEKSEHLDESYISLYDRLKDFEAKQME